MPLYDMNKMSRIMRHIFTFCVGLGLLLPAQAQEKAAYKLYHADGTPASYADLLEDALEQRIVIMGEQHNNPMSHWLVYELAHDLFKKELGLVLTMEQYERDQQPILDSFNVEKLSLAALDTLTRHWPNYKTDYRPLLHFAWQHQVPVIAANIPRPIATAVSQKGLAPVLQGLGDNAWLPQAEWSVDHNQPGYAAMGEMMGGHGMAMDEEKLKRFIEAQAIKDASMAWWVVQAVASDLPVVHINGAYHSNNHDGTLESLQARVDGVPYYITQFWNLDGPPSMLTINTVVQHHIGKLDEKHHYSADYILVVPDSMPTSY